MKKIGIRMIDSIDTYKYVKLSHTTPYFQKQAFIIS